MDETTLKASITGKVQGVFFRAWTQEQATSRGLTGWVCNETDGSVTALLHGDEDAVREMVAALHEGPHDARVDRIETEPADTPKGDGFKITG